MRLRPRSRWEWLLLVSVAAAIAVGGVSVWWLSSRAVAVHRLTRGVGDTVFYGADGKLDDSIFEKFSKPADAKVLTEEQVREQALSALADETRRMLDEEVVAAPMDIDLAMITGAGFPFNDSL